MLQSFAKLGLAGVLLLVGVSTFLAQTQAQWKVGDKVEILNLSKEWVAGTVIGTVDWNGQLMYRVQLDDANAPNVYFNHSPVSDIRMPGNKNPKHPPEKPDDGNPNVNKNGGAFRVGDRVDTFYDARRGHNRGTVVEAGDRKYKVHYNGCTKTFDEWVDASLIRTAATISADAPEIKFLSGRWRTTVVAVGGNYAVWGKTPGIEINANGSYVWFQASGKPSVKGRWTTDAKVPGLVEGTPKFDGIVFKDADGNEWKAFKWNVKGGNQDGIEIDRMCLGLSEVGTRVR